MVIIRPPTNSASYLYGHALWNASVNQLSFRSVQVDLPKSLAQTCSTILSEYQKTSPPPAAFTLLVSRHICDQYDPDRVSVMNITETRINVYYRKKICGDCERCRKDTIYNLVRSYMAVTPEVITKQQH